MFEKWGKKFAEGVKKEVSNPETIDKLLGGIFKIGILLAVIIIGKSEHDNQESKTVIVNNYIYKEEHI